MAIQRHSKPLGPPKPASHPYLKLTRGFVHTQKCPTTAEEEEEDHLSVTRAAATTFATDESSWLTRLAQVWPTLTERPAGSDLLHELTPPPPESDPAHLRLFHGANPARHRAKRESLCGARETERD
jgi:hypothetical protein